MNTWKTNQTRAGAVYGLAGVGFIALVAAGMWLAIYSARFVPTAVNSLSAAAVSLGSFFVPAPDTTLSVVPTATTTIPFGEATSTATSTPVATTTAPTNTVTPTPTAGQQTTTVTQIGSGTTTPSLYGLPDLSTTITAIGYLATTSVDSFVASTTVPKGARPAVKFTIKNVGTNATGSWRFSASIPTQTSYLYLSNPQQSLLPGESIDYTLGFDQSNKGAAQRISISANYDNAVAETTTNNNGASATITVLGS